MAQLIRARRATRSKITRGKPRTAPGSIGRCRGATVDRAGTGRDRGSLSTTSSSATRGGFAAFGAYLFWGVVPLYWKLLGNVDATELIAHRIVWSLAFLLVIQALRRRLASLRSVLRDRAALRQHLTSGLLLSANWLIYIWGVHHGFVIECSLGYFLVPLLNAALGRLVLRETLRSGQRIALGLAAAGVLLLVVQVGRVPWIALGLAGSFGFYGLIRKQSPVGPMTGLAMETLLVAPFAVGYLAWLAAGGRGAIGHVPPATTALVFSTGVVTAIPLLMFAYGAQRLRFTTLGLLQYVAPTCQFLLGWLVYHEPFTSAQAWAFGLIWAGLGCYTMDAWRAGRAGRVTTTPGTPEPSRP